MRRVLEEHIQPAKGTNIQELPVKRESLDQRQTTPLKWKVNIQVAASNGARLGLVELRGKGVRFPHGQMQAYLGSWLIGEALKEPDFVKRAFAAPGRELLIALVMFSRRKEADAARPDKKHDPPSWRSWLSARLCKAAEAPKLADVKRIELLTAAVEVDSVDTKSLHRHAVEKLVGCWNDVDSWEDAPRDAKFLAIVGVGDAARRLIITEEEGQKRLRAAGQGGDKPDQVPPPGSASPPKTRDDLVQQAIKCAQGKSPAFGLYLRLYQICCREPNYRIRLAAAQEIGRGGNEAFEELKYLFRYDVPKNPAKRRDRIKQRAETLGEGQDRYRYSVQAWLLPMLVGSGSEGAERRLGEWLDLVGEGMPPWLEASLAQGFKYAANRRPQYHHESAKERAYLAARAEEMLGKADYWFSRLTLLHALGLWALSAELHAADDQAGRRDPRHVVERWTGRRDGRKQQHRFVEEAGKLVMRALDTGHPERFIWVDESGATSTVGSRPESERPGAMRELWISPSDGWLVLDKRARQLLADVMILVTLAERGDRPEDWEANYGKINKDELPHCLTKERVPYLRPIETAGEAEHLPGDTCKDGCPVQLCPYPPKGQRPHRVELSETFCRDQLDLHKSTQRRYRRGAWQNAPRFELRRFWKEMERRART